METIKRINQFNSISLLVLMSVMLLIISSCKTNEIKDHVAEQDREDVANLIANANVQESTPIDLSNEGHYRFYMNQLKLAGITKEDHPQLFKSLEDTKAKHTEYGVTQDVETDVEEDPLTTIYAFSGLGNDPNAPSGDNYMGSGFSSVNGGTQYSLLTMRLYDTTQVPLDTLVQVTQEFSNGEYLTINAYGELTSSNALYAIYSYYYIDNNSTPHGPSYKYAYTTDTPSSITVNDPENKLGGEEIVVCMNRAHDDCDYGTNDVPQGNVMFPLNGSITYDGVIDTTAEGKPTSGTYSISLARNGGCYVTLTSPTNFFDYTTISADGKTLSWNVPAADFDSTCLAHLYYEDVTFNQFIGVLIDNRFVGATITNATEAVCDDQSVKCIPEMEVVSGCLASGTLITMADGNSLPIEKVEVLEKVLANNQGKELTVEYTTIGFETVPIYVITDNLGHEMMITAMHAVPTVNRGVRVVEELIVGDQLYTQDGDAKIVSINQVPYAKKVWNLAVGSLDEPVNAKQANTTFFANRILVGDSRMQTYFSQKYRLSPETVLQKLPKEWHIDYQNYLKKNAK